MNRRIFGTSLGTIVLVALASAAQAQPRDNFVSEADRQRANFNRSASVDFQIRQGIARQSGVGGAFGTSVSAPSALNSVPTRQRAASFGGGTVASAGGKPFANVSPAPTVSPYMNLFRTDFGGNDDLNFQTLVQPQLRQQEFNRQISMQEQQLNRRVQALSARNAFSPQGSPNIMPTGHGATHRYFSHFYPQLNRR